MMGDKSPTAEMAQLRDENAQLRALLEVTTTAIGKLADQAAAWITHGRSG